MKKYFKYIIGILAVAFLMLFLSKVDFEVVFSEVLKVKWWMLAIILSSFCAYILATKAWQISFGLPASLTPKMEKLFVIRQLGETLTLVNPTNIVGGELSKLYMLRSSGYNTSENETSIVLSRSLIILSYIFLVIVAMVLSLLRINQSIDQSLMFIMVIVAISLFFGVFYFLTSKRLILYSTIRKGLSFFRNSKIEKFVIGIQKLNQDMSQFYAEHSGQMSLAFLLSLGHWLLGSLEFYFILTALEYDVTFLDAIIIEMGVMVFKSLGGFVPGQIGVEEYGNKVMLGFLGIPDLDVWVVVSILRRARQLFWIAVSFAFLGIFYKSYRWKSSL